ncbi:short transient receptor potential channel 4-like [Glandiceps talaboti]
MAITKEDLVPLDECSTEYVQLCENTGLGTENSIQEDFLSAVEKSNYARVEEILSQHQCAELCSYQGKRKGISIKALEIAAKRDDFFMIKLLLENGANLLERPDFDDPTTLMEEKINMYSAVSSPAYITMTYLYLERKNSKEEGKKNSKEEFKDFMQTAFHLIEELNDLLKEEISLIWKAKIAALQHRLKVFTLHVLQCCHSVNEVKWLLGGGYYDTHDDKDDHSLCDGRHYTLLSMLTLERRPKRFLIAEKAIATEQKEFIAHPMVQKFLRGQWTCGQPEWTQKNGFGWELLYAIFAFFVFGILHQIFPVHIIFCTRTRLHHLYDSPKASFLSHYFHYAFFLILMFIYEVLVQFKIEGSEVRNEGYMMINHKIILAILIIWFITLCFIELGQLITYGVTGYFKSNWNLLDLFILATFFISIILANPDIVGQIYGNPYIYIILSKLTAFTYVCALLRFLKPFLLSHYLGPTLLVFTSMRHDIIRFLIIFTYVIVAYALAMYYFYVNVGPENSVFAKFSSSLTVLMTSIFGGVGTESLEINSLVWQNISNEHNEWVDITIRYYTAMGYILYVSFGLIVLIMLLNLCIAMLSDRYTKLQENIDREWKFERSSIWLDYIGSTGANLNSLSSVVCLLVGIICTVCMMCCKCCKCGFAETDGPVREVSPTKTDKLEMTDVEPRVNTVALQLDDERGYGSLQQKREQPTHTPCPAYRQGAKLKYKQILNVLLKRYIDKHVDPQKETASATNIQPEGSH